ncbi:UPF0648 protein [Elsinoe australis]|uniref:UPF0648 protein n=1 Tax=Elsinoe australis TaxID=40998 RepID=A0A2P7Z2Z9_9PEZI|nr:UPF0648 protein [Elsinoe australis]
MVYTTTTLIALAATLSTSFAAYVPKTTLTGDEFFTHFDFYSGPDPTKGFVQYVNRDTAINSGLIAMADHPLANASVYIGVDSTNPYPASGPGRQSIRLHGKDAFTHGLVTVDIYHAPTGCGLWPAIWMVDPNGVYPGNTGEIDLFEYVHDSPANSVTLHTSEGCKITNNTSPAAPASRFRRETAAAASAMTGRVESQNCYVNAPEQTYNKGCSIASPADISPPPSAKGQQSLRQQTFATAGTGFNEQGGGVYALVWTSDLIEAYFFPRPSVPAELSINPSKEDGSVPAGRSVDPAAWKAQGIQPVARFQGCDFDQHIRNVSLVVNADFCGDWAGNDAVWEQSGCKAKTGAGTCNEYVGANPKAFEDAYWLLGGIEVWEGQ